MIGPVGERVPADEVRSLIGVQDEFEAAVWLVQCELALDNCDNTALSGERSIQRTAHLFRQ